MKKMVQGYSLGIECIKTEHKEGNEQIKTLHYKINDILYKYNKQYISNITAKRLINGLTGLGKELKGVDTTDKIDLKKQEILKALRTVVKNLQGYVEDFSWDEVDRTPIQSIVNYCVAQYVKMKKEGQLTDDSILKLLNRQKEIINDFILPASDTLKNLNMEAFRKMNDELLNALADRYGYLSLIS